MEATQSLRLARSVEGVGEPAVMFLPGWCGDRTVFDDLVRLSGENRQAVSLDWRGHGGSWRPAEDFGTEQLVEDAVMTARELGIDSFVPVALSHAGWVAIELRRRLGPETVRGVVLLDWMVLGPPPPFLEALAGLRDPDVSESVRLALFSMWTSGLDLPRLESYVASMGEYGFDMWSRAGREIADAFERDGSPLSALSRLETPCPTLHLYAQPDDPAFLEAQREFSGAHPWFRVEHLAARSHFPMFEIPEEISQQVERFVSELDLD